MSLRPEFELAVGEVGHPHVDVVQRPDRQVVDQRDDDRRHQDNAEPDAELDDQGVALDLMAHRREVPDDADAAEDLALVADLLGEGHRIDLFRRLPVHPARQGLALLVGDVDREQIGFLADDLVDDRLQQRPVLGDQRLQRGRGEHVEGLLALLVQRLAQIVGLELLDHHARREGDDENRAGQGDDDLAAQREMHRAALGLGGGRRGRRRLIHCVGRHRRHRRLQAHSVSRQARPITHRSAAASCPASSATGACATRRPSARRGRTCNCSASTRG